MRETSLSLAVTLATIALVGGVSLETYQNPAVCPDRLNGTTVYIAHETDCTKYYKCTYDRKVLLECASYSPGQLLHFDPVRQVCSWPWSTTCISKSPDCSQNGYRESYPYDCSKYYECHNGWRSLKQCEVGQLFDGVKRTCTPEESTTCKLYKDTCPTEKLLVSVYLSHECSCNAYYECEDGEYIERWCPYGKAFDINLRTCITSGKAVCDPKSGDKPYPTVECPATGTIDIPHETDCSLYYECVNGVKNEKACKDGLSFDAVKGMCTWPLSSDCSSKSLDTTQLPAPYLLDANEEIAPRNDDFKCPLEQSNKVTRFPHHCSASKFYACEQGRMYLNTCPDGLVYDYIRQTCADPTSATFDNQEVSTLLNKKAAYLEECPQNGRVLIPHETNCSLYYVCANGNRSLAHSCYSGHYFNPEISSCDLPENTKCHISPLTTSSTTTITSPTWCSVSDTKCRLYPDSCNCNMYSQCEDDRIVTKVCPGQLYFDDTLQTCNLPQNVNCQLNCTNMCTEGELSPHECQCQKYYKCHDGKQYLEICDPGMTFDSVTRHCVNESENHHCYPDVPDRDCLGTCPSTGIDYLPHTDCKKYCICDNGETEVEECNGWWIYNPDTKQCDWPENIRNLTCDPFPCTAGGDATTIPHECECNLYYECVNSTKHREHCDEGMFYDYVKQICVTTDPHCYQDKENDDAKHCKETCKTMHDSTSITIHEDCTKYCKCMDGNRHVYTCPEDQYFDQERGICDWYENIRNLSCDPYDCGPKDVKVIPHECNCTIYYQCDGTEKIRSTCDDGYYYDYVLRACAKVDAHCMRQYSNEVDKCIGTCPIENSKPSVHLPHEDCTKYCVCSLGRPYLVECSDGLHYNKVEQICTLPETAHCEVTQNTENASVWSGFSFADKFNLG